MSTEPTKAFVTLLTKTSYLSGCVSGSASMNAIRLTWRNALQLVLNASLKEHKSQFPLVVFASATLPQDAREVLQSQGIRVRDIEYLEPRQENRGELDEHDTRFADTWTKLRCFEMVEYEVRSHSSSPILGIDPLRFTARRHGQSFFSGVGVYRSSSIPVTARFGHARPSEYGRTPHDGPTCRLYRRRSRLRMQPSQTDALSYRLVRSFFPPDQRNSSSFVNSSSRIPENCAHTLAKYTIPISPTEFTKPTHKLLNSGLVVLHPSLETFARITTTLHEDPIVKTFKFPDQDLLAYVFDGKFVPLGYQYNALKTLRGCHEAMWRDEDVKNIVRGLATLLLALPER